MRNLWLNIHEAILIIAHSAEIAFAGGAWANQTVIQIRGKRGGWNRKVADRTNATYLLTPPRMRRLPDGGCPHGRGVRSLELSGSRGPISTLFEEFRSSLYIEDTGRLPIDDQFCGPSVRCTTLGHLHL